MATVPVLSVSSEWTNCDGEVFRNPSYGEMDSLSTALHWSLNSATRKSPPETAEWEKKYGFRPYTNHWCKGVTMSHTPGITAIQSLDGCTGGRPDRRYTTRTGVYFNSITLNGTLPISDIDPSELDGLVSQAYSKATDSLWDAATALGELPETLRMLAKTVDRINDIHNWTVKEYIRVFMLRYRHKPLKDVIRLLIKKGPKGLADFWLEYRYGWRPLIKDVESLAQAVAHVRVGPSESVTRGTASMTTSLSEPVWNISQGYNGNNPNVKQLLQVTSSCVRKDKVTVAAVIPNDVLAYRFDLLTTAWERVPLSFVVDWVVDVGKFLQHASDTAMNRAIRTTCCHSKTIKATALVSGHGNVYDPEGEGYFVEKPVVGTVEVFDYTRTVITPGFPTPRMKFRVDGARVIDLWALLLQRVQPLLQKL